MTSLPVSERIRNSFFHQIPIDAYDTAIDRPFETIIQRPHIHLTYYPIF